jgi:hypothetical protein
MSLIERIFPVRPAGRQPLQFLKKPKQLGYGTGGLKLVENLSSPQYSRTFPDYRDLSLTADKCEMHEETSHRGMSAVINLTAQKPSFGN